MLGRWFLYYCYYPTEWDVWICAFFMVFIWIQIPNALSRFKIQEISPLLFSVGATYVPLHCICQDERAIKKVFGLICAVFIHGAERKFLGQSSKLVILGPPSNIFSEEKFTHYYARCSLERMLFQFRKRWQKILNCKGPNEKHRNPAHRFLLTLCVNSLVLINQILKFYMSSDL